MERGEDPRFCSQTSSLTVLEPQHLQLLLSSKVLTQASF